jgi:hypothetical protein
MSVKEQLPQAITRLGTLLPGLAAAVAFLLRRGRKPISRRAVCQPGSRKLRAIVRRIARLYLGSRSISVQVVDIDASLAGFPAQSAVLRPMDSNVITTKLAAGVR